MFKNTIFQFKCFNTSVNFNFQFLFPDMVIFISLIIVFLNCTHEQALRLIVGDKVRAFIKILEETN